MSPLLGLAQLIAFRKGLVGMTQGAYDEAFDAVTEELEKANDQTFRLIANPDDPPEPAGDNR